MFGVKLGNTSLTCSIISNNYCVRYSSYRVETRVFLVAARKEPVPGFYFRKAQMTSSMVGSNAYTAPEVMRSGRGSHVASAKGCPVTRRFPETPVRHGLLF